MRLGTLLFVCGVAWIRVTEPDGGLGSGSRRVSFAVNANPRAGTRTGTITVGAQTFVATQAGTARRLLGRITARGGAASGSTCDSGRGRA